MFNIEGTFFALEKCLHAEEHARSFAGAQPVTPKPAKVNPLAWPLVDNEAVLLHAYRTIVETIDARHLSSSSAGGESSPGIDGCNLRGPERRLSELAAGSHQGIF